jgi:hypothetical protein
MKILSEIKNAQLLKILIYSSVQLLRPVTIAEMGRDLYTLIVW